MGAQKKKKKKNQEWHELKASHTDAFLRKRTLLYKNDLTLLNQRPMSIWVDFLNLKWTTFKSFSQALNRIIIFYTITCTSQAT